MTQSFRKNVWIFLFALYSVNCFSQREGDVALGLSVDGAIDKDYNNFASTFHFRYNLFDRFRVAPSFSHYINKDDKKMQSFALNFHYLFPKTISNTHQTATNKLICFYPIAGIYLSRTSGDEASCESCSSSDGGYRSTSINNFGFDFGAGVDYQLSTNAAFFRNSSIFFEMQYQLVGKYSRPIFSFGMLYVFKKKGNVSRGTQKKQRNKPMLNAKTGSYYYGGSQRRY